MVFRDNRCPGAYFGLGGLKKGYFVFRGRIVIKIGLMIYIYRKDVSSEFHDGWSSRKNIEAKKPTKYRNYIAV
jgi:hypothetical protein